MASGQDSHFKAQDGTKGPVSRSGLKGLALFTAGLGVFGASSLTVFPGGSLAQAQTSAQNTGYLMPGSPDVPRIVAMQEDLLTLSYPLDSCGANGIFGTDELQALNAFQKALGQKETDYADSATLQKLADAASHQRRMSDDFSKAGNAEKELKARRDMREIQAALEIAGYKKGGCRLTGVLDAETTAAIGKLQKDFQLLPVTGLLNNKTRDALRSAAEKSAGDSGVSHVMVRDNLDIMTAAMYGSHMTPQQLRGAALAYIKGRKVPEYIAESVVEASEKTGMDFTYLMDIGGVESGYRPWAKATMSTAVGPFQFVDESWMIVFRKNGERYGYGDLIRRMDNPRENDRANIKEYVMSLRRDPRISAIMAAEFALDNKKKLESLGISRVTKTHLYLAHFLGATEAVRFLKLMDQNPAASAAPQFEGAAQRNPGVFFDARRKPLSYSEIYKFFSSRMSGETLRMVAVRKARKMTDMQP